MNTMTDSNITTRINWKIIVLRIVLGIILLANLLTIISFSVDMDMAVKMYGGEMVDDLHRFSGATLAAAVFSFSVAAALAMSDPYEYRSLVLLLIIFHFMTVCVDVVLLLNGFNKSDVLLPQAIYDGLITVTLLICYPATKRLV